MLATVDAVHGSLHLTRHPETPLRIHRFVRWVETQLETHGEQVLRLEGVLDVAGGDTPVVVHGVQHVFHPLENLLAWPAGGARCSRLVVVTTDLDPVVVEHGFRRDVLG